MAAVTNDPEADVLYVELAHVKDSRNEGEEVHPGVALMFDTVGKLIGIEIRPEQTRCRWCGGWLAVPGLMHDFAEHLPCVAPAREPGERLALGYHFHIASSLERAIRETALYYEENMKVSDDCASRER